MLQLSNNLTWQQVQQVYSVYSNECGALLLSHDSKSKYQKRQQQQDGMSNVCKCPCTFFLRLFLWISAHFCSQAPGVPLYPVTPVEENLNGQVKPRPHALAGTCFCRRSFIFCLCHQSLSLSEAPCRSDNQGRASMLPAYYAAEVQQQYYLNLGATWRRVCHQYAS